MLEGTVVFVKDFVHLSVGVRLELITSRAKRAFRRKIITKTFQSTCRFPLYYVAACFLQLLEIF